MLALYVAVLAPCGRPLRAHVQTPLVRATEFLHRDYKIDFYYWELLELSRRTFLIGWVLLIPTEATFLRLVLALLVSVASFAVLLSTYPYKRQEDNLLAACCQLTLIFSFISLIRLHEGFSAYLPKSTVQAVMYFANTTVIATPLAAITFVMVRIMLTIMVAIISNEGRVESIRLVATGAEPHMDYHPGQRWHLFLSHAWATSQDQCAVIKRQLTRMLPGIGIFLDVRCAASNLVAAKSPPSPY